MTSDFYLLKTEFDPKRCVIDSLPSGTKQEYRIKAGEAMGSRFPKGGVIKMSKSHAGIEVADAIPNTFDFLIASAKLRALVADHRPEGVEYLPFTLKDHKNKVVAGEFCIVNPLGSIACIDAAKTEGKKSAMEPDQYLILTRLQIDAARVPEGTDVFRLGEMTNKIVVSGAFAKAVKKLGVKALRCVAMGEKI